MTKVTWPLKIKENTWLYADGVWYTRYYNLLNYKFNPRCPKCRELIEESVNWKPIPNKYGTGEGGIYGKHSCGAFLSALNNLQV